MGIVIKGPWKDRNQKPDPWASDVDCDMGYVTACARQEEWYRRQVYLAVCAVDLDSGNWRLIAATQQEVEYQIEQRRFG